MKIQLYSDWTKKQLLHFEKRNQAKTGIYKIDENFGYPTGFYVIAGSPGAGKGWFATWISRQFYIHDQLKSVYFSLEMSEQVVRTRILQQWSDLTKKEMDNGGDTSMALDYLQKDVILINEFYSQESHKQTPQEFYNLFENYYRLGYRVFHFDHLHEISGANDNNRNQNMMEVWAKTFQKISKEFKDTWVFVYVQPNGKGYEKNILKKGDISGSKVIIQKCDFFISINREETDSFETESRNILLYLDKNRYTDQNHVAFKIYFHPNGNFYSSGEEIYE